MWDFPLYRQTERIPSTHESRGTDCAVDLSFAPPDPLPPFSSLLCVLGSWLVLATSTDGPILWLPVRFGYRGVWPGDPREGKDGGWKIDSHTFFPVGPGRLVASWPVFSSCKVTVSTVPICLWHLIMLLPLITGDLLLLPPKVLVMIWTVSSQNSYVEVLTFRTSDCKCFWRLSL